MRAKFWNVTLCAMMLLLLFMMTITATCGRAAASVLPEKLELSAAGGEQLEVNTTKEVQVKFFPPDSTERGITWTVRNSDLVRILPSSTDVYVIEGLFTGSTTLTAVSDANPEVTASLEVTVVYADAARPDSGGCDSNGFGSRAAFLLLLLFIPPYFYFSRAGRAADVEKS